MRYYVKINGRFIAAAYTSVFMFTSSHREAMTYAPDEVKQIVEKALAQPDDLVTLELIVS